jgi:hypothetical protein
MSVSLVLVGRSGSRYLSDIRLHDLKSVRNGIVERTISVYGRYLDRGWFYSRLVSRGALGE